MLPELPKEAGLGRGTAEHKGLPCFPGVHFYHFHILSFSISCGEGAVPLKDSRGPRITEEIVSIQGYSNEFFSSD